MHWRPCLFRSPMYRAWNAGPVGLPQTAGSLDVGHSDTNQSSRGWRSLTFLGLLELSWPCRKDQFGSNSKFSIILRSIIFIFLSLRMRGRAQKQDLAPASQNQLCHAGCPTPPPQTLLKPKDEMGVPGGLALCLYRFTAATSAPQHGRSNSLP